MTVSTRRPRVLYADVDGTLVGAGGSLFATAEGAPTGAAAEALAALHRAGVALVLVSGRTRGRLAEVARVLGAAGYVAELGALLVDGTGPEAPLLRCFGAYRGQAPPAEAIARSGAGALLLERFRGRLELHEPWSREPREASLLLRGLVDPAEATAALEAAGLGWLELLDNGKLRRPFPDLDLPEVHAYHLVPRGVRKATAVRLHLERRGWSPEDAWAVGDAPADLELAGTVGAFVLLGGPAPDLPRNALVVGRAGPEGFAEAVAALLARA